MGCGGSSADVKESTTNVSLVQNDQIQEAGTVIPITVGDFKDPQVKILTLGAGECGKSTIWRQLKIVYCNGFDEEETSTYISVVRINLLGDIKTLIEEFESSGQTASSDIDQYINLIKGISLSDTELTPEVGAAIAAVWADPVIKFIYEQSNSLGLGENASFFLDSAERIAAKDYTPSNDDLLKSRIRTNGINEFFFMIDKKKTMLVDVGGQKSERQHWSKCFNNVNFLLFVVSLSDFDQTMFEQVGQSRTQDSIKLFEKIANVPIFQETPIFLVLNKLDVFKRKFQNNFAAFQSAYPEYTGSSTDVDAAIKHIKNCYIQTLTGPRSDKAFVKHITTCAMDPESIRDLFQTIAREVVKN